jgi:hypothetical protein
MASDIFRGRLKKTTIACVPMDIRTESCSLAMIQATRLLGAAVEEPMVTCVVGKVKLSPQQAAEACLVVKC